MTLDPESMPDFARLAYTRARGMDRAEDYVEWAQAAFERGLESESLTRLAVAEQPFFTPDLRALFDRAGEELGIAPITRRQGILLGARDLARGIIEGRIPPGDGAASLNHLFSPYVRDGVPFPEMQHWRRLDDAYDCEHCRAIVEEAGKPLDEAVLDAARNLLLLDWRSVP